FRVTVYQVEKINVLDKGRKADPNAPEEEEAADVPEQSSAETPSTEQPSQTEDAPPVEQQPEKPKLKKRIDEDSPFFLE
ncbi:MAG: hypothetical protein IKP58_10675, partial [Victivallales bacterium]|nr:hypothetical protein [Victivallales bacterium]